jgi:amidase
MLASMAGTFGWRDDEIVRAAARRAERVVLDGSDLPPFHGVPIPAKGLTQDEGQPAVYGSPG